MGHTRGRNGKNIELFAHFSTYKVSKWRVFGNWHHRCTIKSERLEYIPIVCIIASWLHRNLLSWRVVPMFTMKLAQFPVTWYRSSNNDSTKHYACLGCLDQEWCYKCCQLLGRAWVVIILLSVDFVFSFFLHNHVTSDDCTDFVIACYFDCN